MPTWSFVRDSIVVAALVIVVGGAVSLTTNLVIFVITPHVGDSARPDVFAIGALYLIAVGLVFFLKTTHERPARS